MPGQLVSQIYQTSYLFFAFQDDINRRRKETLVAITKDLPTEGKEETGRENIHSEEESTSPAHQSFKEAVFSWSQVLKDSDK